MTIIYNWGGGGGVDIIQMHFHLYLQPNKMGLTKLKLASHKRCTYSKKRTLPGLQGTTPAKHIKGLYVFQDQKTTPKRRRKQLFGGFTDDNVEVPLSYSPKTCKSHVRWFISKHRTIPEQHRSKLWRSSGIIGQQCAGGLLAETLPIISKSNIAFRVCVDVVRFLTCADARTFRYQEETLLWWYVMWKFGGERVLRTCGGMKLMGACLETDGRETAISPSAAHINFIVSSTCLHMFSTPALPRFSTWNTTRGGFPTGTELF